MSTFNYMSLKIIYLSIENIILIKKIQSKKIVLICLISLKIIHNTITLGFS